MRHSCRGAMMLDVYTARRYVHTMHTATTLATLDLAALTIARAILATLDRLPGAVDAGARQLRASVRALTLAGGAAACRELAEALAARTFRPEDRDDTDDAAGDPRFAAMSLALACDALGGALASTSRRGRALKLARAAAALDAWHGAVSVDPTTRRAIVRAVEAVDPTPAGYASTSAE